MKPFPEFIRYSKWKDQFLQSYPKVQRLWSSLRGEEKDDRFSMALASMYVGGMEHRLNDKSVKRWARWACEKTYKTYNAFSWLSDIELCFIFYSIGKLFIPLLLHEKGVNSESFKSLTQEEQEEAVSQVLDTLWENHLIRLLQILPYEDLNSTIR